MTILDGIREYFLSCNFLKDGVLNVDYLPHDVGYSMEPMPTEPIIKKYVDGGALKQFQFLFCSREPWGNDTITNIENNGFYEELSQWIENNNIKRFLPNLGNAREPQRIEVLTSGYLMGNTEDTAIYQIQLRLIYYEGAC